MDDYDLILTADIDIIVNRWVDIFPLATDGLTLAKRIDNDGFNTGIVVWGRQAREFTKKNFDLDRANKFDMPDQDELHQYWTKDDINWIPSEWNDWRFTPSGIFWHYKGRYKERYRG